MRLYVLLLLALVVTGCAAAPEQETDVVERSLEDSLALLEASVGDAQALQAVVGAPSEQEADALIAFFAGLDELAVTASNATSSFDALAAQSRPGVNQSVQELARGVRYLHARSAAEQVALLEAPRLQAGSNLSGEAHLPFVFEEGKWFLSTRLHSLMLSDTEYLVSVQVDDSEVAVGLRDAQGRFVFLPGANHTLEVVRGGEVVCSGPARLVEVEDELPSGDVHVGSWHAITCSGATRVGSFALVSNASSVRGSFLLEE